MTTGVKMALILAAAIIGSVALWMYFSPYQQCVRDTIEAGHQPNFAHSFCGRNSN